MGEEEEWELPAGSAQMEPPCPTQRRVHSRRVRGAQREKLWSPYGDRRGTSSGSDDGHRDIIGLHVGLFVDTVLFVGLFLNCLINRPIELRIF